MAPKWFANGKHMVWKCDLRATLVGKQLGMPQVLYRTYPRYLGRRTEQRVCYLACNHVGFVAARNRDYHVGVICTGLHQDIRM